MQRVKLQRHTQYIAINFYPQPISLYSFINPSSWHTSPIQSPKSLKNFTVILRDNQNVTPLSPH